MSSKFFLPTAVDIMVIWDKFTIPVRFSSLIRRMSTFTLAISCLITSNLPWFMDLTFQVPMQYCSVQRWTLLPSPVTSITWCSFLFGSASSFFLELFLHWASVAYWSTTWGIPPSLFYLFAFSYFFMGFSRQECWSGLPFPSPMDNIFVRTLHPDSFILSGTHGMAHSFIKLCKAVVRVPIWFRINSNHSQTLPNIEMTETLQNHFMIPSLY